MWPFSNWTTAARAALMYITIGAFTVAWTAVWYVYLFNNPPVVSGYYWCTGFLVTGLTMVLIGLGLSRFSPSTAVAVPPAAPAPVVLHLQPNAAPPPAPVLVPLNSASPTAALNGQVAAPPPQETLAGMAGGIR